MWLIIGLGNPGPKYLMTRHNAGFMMLDLIASENQATFASTKFKGDLAKVNLFAKDCLLFKPMTYMNLSGQAVRPLAAFYKIPVENMIVIHDDLDMEPGKTKLRQGGGGHGGHNGIKSMVAELGSNAFTRIKVGVGRPAVGDVADWVLRNFSEDELDQLRQDVFGEVKDRLQSVMTSTGATF